MRNSMWMVAAAVATLVGCSGSSSSGSTGGSGTTGTSGSSGSGGTTGSQTLYQKYGEDAGMWHVVGDAVTGLLADPNEAPYFTSVLGKPGHDTPTRLEGCLVLQFATVMGAPGASYPGKNFQGDSCEDMKTAHAGIGVPGPVFDQFVMDLGAVLKKDGVQDADISTLAGVLVSLKSDVVQPPSTYFYCADAGPATAPAGYDGGCL